MSSSSALISSNSVIGVTGVSGHLGRLILQGLQKKVAASQLVGFARTPSKVADQFPGVDIRVGDYDNEDQLATSLKGVNVLVLVSSSAVGQRVQQHTRAVHAAKKAGVSYIIYTSVLYADSTTIGPIATEHAPSEKAIIESGLKYTFLRNGWYFENWTGSIGGVLASKTVIGSAGEGIISLASRADYADAAIRVAVDALAQKDTHFSKAYELGGEPGYTLGQYAAEIAKQSGQDIKFANLPENEYSGLLTKFGLPELVAKALASADVAAAKGGLQLKEKDRKVLSDLIGRPTTTVAEAVKSGLAAISKA